MARTRDLTGAIVAVVGETGLATRPLAGTAPPMAEGLAPAAVAERIVAAIVAGEREVAGNDF